jgi:serine/threonine protein kinase
MTPSETVDRVATLPRQFGRYELQRQLGKGGMGTVYLARDTQLERLVALKVPNLEGDPSHARQFLREARAAAALHHPNICPVYDSGEIDGRPFLTMAYVEGEPLSARVSRGPLPIDEATSLVRTLADALDEAHRAGVVHRDLKPANILYNSKGQPVITDFGLARRSTSTSGMSSSGQGIFGTPAYMAPEQVNGDSKTIGPTSDVYALGVVLYELLTGTRPFDGTLGTLLARITTEDTEPPSRRRPEIDERLDALCLKALAKKPNERFKSMAAFAAAIDDWQAGPTITIVSRPSVKKRKASRRGIWLTAGVGAAAVAIVVTAVLIAGNGRASRTDPTSIAPVVKKEVPAPKSK